MAAWYYYPDDCESTELYVLMTGKTIEMYSSTSSTMMVRRPYASRVRWRLPGEIQTLRAVNDLVFAITKNGGSYTGYSSINSLRSTVQVHSSVMTTLKPGGPYLDFLSPPESVVYENKETKFYTKFPLLDDKKPRWC